MKEIIERYYRENFNRLVKAYTRKAGSVENAEDIIQEAFTLALQYSNSYDERYCNFKAWFDRITLNVFRAKLRDERRIGMTEEVDEELIEQEELNLFEQKLVDCIREEIAKRTPHIAEQLDLYFFKQYGVKQITQITGVPYLTVQKTVQRFQHDIRKRYEKEGGIR